MKDREAWHAAVCRVIVGYDLATEQEQQHVNLTIAWQTVTLIHLFIHQNISILYKYYI